MSQTTQSNGTGDYVFNLLQVGNYTVKVEAKGCKRADKAIGALNPNANSRQIQFGLKFLF